MDNKIRDSILKKIGKIVQTGIVLIVCSVVAVGQNRMATFEKSSTVYRGVSINQDITKSTVLNKIISMNVQDVPLLEAVKEIAAKANLELVYNSKLLEKKNRSITTSLEQVTVEKALWAVLKDTGLRFAVSADKQLVLLEQKEAKNTLHRVAAATQETITGNVTDGQSGETLPGVNILIRGTSSGTSTDENGDFELTVESLQDTLVVSYIGYQTEEVPVAGRLEINIAMEPQAITGEEMVVVGFGEQMERNVTSSTSSITGNDLKEAPVGDIGTLLAGRMPGLVTHNTSGAPGAGSTLLVRGRSTTGSTSPAILVDGVQRSFNNLDPNEIEDITILKDAAAAAVYGVKGANGVILVTTKEGVKKEPELSYKSSFSLSQNTRFPEFLDGVQYANYYNKARDLDGLSPLFSESDIDKIKNGDPDGLLGNTNWLNQVFNKNAPSIHHNLSIEGGTERTTYFLSLGYFDQEGSIENYNFKRYNLRSNINTELTPSLDASINLTGRFERTEQPFSQIGNNAFAGIVQQAMRAHPYVPMYTPEGEPTATPVVPSVANPIAARDRSGHRDSKSTIFESNLSLSYDTPFIDGLNLEMMASYDRDHRFNKIFNTPYELQVFYISQMQYQEEWGPNARSGEAFLNQGSNDGYRLTLRPSVRYSTTLANKHQIDVLALYEQSSRVTNNFSAEKRDFDFLELPELNFGNRIDDASAVQGLSAESPRAGFVGRINYSYDDKYLLEVASRYDGSYRFPKDKRWGFFPAVSAGWIVSEENFFDNIDSISFLKLIASVGKTGNDQIGEYQYLSTIQLNKNAVVFGENLQNAIYTSNIPNRNITWETTMAYNGGVEANFWNELLGMKFEWFYQKTTDILQSQSGIYPPSIGGNYPSIINYGIVDNRGFDLEMSHRNDFNDFTYGINLNVNWARNRILKYDDSPNAPSYQKYTGKSIGGKLGYISQGLFQSDEEATYYPNASGDAQAGDIRYKDLNGDGKITWDQDRTFVGKSNIPRLMFGLNLDAQWRGFDFSSLIQGGAISDLALMGLYPGIGWTGTEYTRMFYQGGNSPVYLAEGSWTPENTDAPYPRLSSTSTSNNDWGTTFWIRDASYVRLKNLQLGYTLPKIFLNRVGIKSLRIYLTGSNLLTISSLKYVDPEAPDVNNGYYPQQRTFAIGLNLTF